MASAILDEVQEEVKMDMTPMIDVVFLLIIFFLCIDFRILEAKLPAYLPKDSGSRSTPTEPIEKLSLKIECVNRGDEVPRKTDKDGVVTSIRLVGHRVRYHVATVKVSEVPDLVEELKRVYNDRSKWQKGEDGVPKPMPVVIEPGTNSVYGDVASAVDAVRKVGFEDIQFGGGMGAAKK